MTSPLLSHHGATVLGVLVAEDVVWLRVRLVVHQRMAVAVARRRIPSGSAAATMVTMMAAIHHQMLLLLHRHVLLVLCHGDPRVSDSMQHHLRTRWQATSVATLVKGLPRHAAITNAIH